MGTDGNRMQGSRRAQSDEEKKEGRAQDRESGGEHDLRRPQETRQRPGLRNRVVREGHR